MMHTSLLFDRPPQRDLDHEAERSGVDECVRLFLVLYMQFVGRGCLTRVCASVCLQVALGTVAKAQPLCCHCCCWVQSGLESVKHCTSLLSVRTFL